ncbi:MAG TPA: biotin--[acetyl-CoA-carboxylase] ligase, partial [Hydrogenophaga sp.]
IARPVAARLPAAPGRLAPVEPAGLAELCMGQTAGETLALVAPALVRNMRRFEREGFQPFAERFAQRDALAGLELKLSDGTLGVGMGVDASGALQLKTAHGSVTVTSSEVSVRPC